MSRLRLLGLLFALVLALPLQAREAAPLAADEATEKRLVTISSELRCPSARTNRSPAPTPNWPTTCVARSGR